MIGTHLGCPLGLGNHHLEKTQADAARNVREILRQGGLYYGWQYQREPAAWNFTDVMYPDYSRWNSTRVWCWEQNGSTPPGRDVSAGRTVRPPRFTWSTPRGTACRRAWSARSAAHGRRLYEIRMPGDHFAILVKRS